jgi:alpha-methylacyl-CoA racemase
VRRRPLDGVTVVELAGIGPVPFAGMLLSDLGADVVRVDRPAMVAGADPARPTIDPMARGKRSVGVDLKHPDGVATVLRLVAGADVLIEGFRPGVAERLGVGPDACLAANGRLVYGRMTGWGQEGPLADEAGHDIDYLAVAGVLAHIGRAGAPPTPPINLVADFGGGANLLVVGVLAALFDAGRTGVGTVVDAAMVDGAALLMAPFWAARATGFWQDERGTNLLDSGAYFYDVYECADGRFVAVGAMEAQFHAALLAGLGLDEEDDLPEQLDRSAWPAMKERLAEVFRTRSRDEWVATFAGADACVAPVLTMGEAAEHPHLRARGTIVESGGVLQPAPAPRVGGALPLPGPPAAPGAHTDEVLHEVGLTPDEVDRLRAEGAVA